MTLARETIQSLKVRRTAFATPMQRTPEASQPAIFLKISRAEFSECGERRTPPPKSLRGRVHRTPAAPSRTKNLPLYEINQRRAALSRGGARPGAGRKRGYRSPYSRRAIAESARAVGVTPLEYMLAIINDEAADNDVRDRMAIAAAPFVHRKARNDD
jgi:hypothetical protein